MTQKYTEYHFKLKSYLFGLSYLYKEYIPGVLVRLGRNSLSSLINQYFKKTLITTHISNQQFKSVRIDYPIISVIISSITDFKQKILDIFSQRKILFFFNTQSNLSPITRQSTQAGILVSLIFYDS